MGNIFQLKVPAAIYIGNGFGKLAGYSQVKELGNIETPIILTNTLSVPTASDALITYTLALSENKNIYSVNSIVGVLVQTNFGGVLEINGVPIAKELNNYSLNFKYDADGSCMIVVITDAPLDSRNLERLAKRAIMGLAKTGGIASNGSGDYVIAVSTAKDNLVPYSSNLLFNETKMLRNNVITPLFLATIEATEETILNSLFAAETMTGRKGHKILSLPVNEVLDIMKKYNKIKN